MTLPVIILGAGGHAKVLISTLSLLQREVIGITEADNQKHGDYLSGIPIIGDDDVILNYKPDKIELVNGIGSVGPPKIRMHIYNKCKKQGYSFTQVFHPSAIIMKDVQVGEGSQIMAGAIIQSGCCIGDNAIINTGAIIDHDSKIGNHTHIAPGVVISGSVQIGNMAHVGTAATIIQGIKIGQSVLVGAGSVVVNNISSELKVAGVPALEIED